MIYTMFCARRTSKLTMNVLLSLQFCPSKGLKDTLNICCGRLDSDMFLSWDLGFGRVKYSL